MVGDLDRDLGAGFDAGLDSDLDCGLDRGLDFTPPILDVVVLGLVFGPILLL